MARTLPSGPATSISAIRQPGKRLARGTHKPFGPGRERFAVTDTSATNALTERRAARGVHPRRPALVDVRTARQELALPPKLTYGQIKGFTLGLGRPEPSAKQDRPRSTLTCW